MTCMCLHKDTFQVDIFYVDHANKASIFCVSVLYNEMVYINYFTSFNVVCGFALSQ